MRRSLAALVVFCTTVSACTPASTATALVGTYVLSIGVDTLELRVDGHYRRLITDIGARHVAVDTGRWRLANGGRLVALAALPNRWPDHGRFDPISGAWHLPDTMVRRTEALIIGASWRGAVTLGLKPELGWRYRRVAPR
ncbi:MAG: hypothetical protein P3B98_04145 [Gemmatimonadota bacterium]|nr:hypothetical protein [Gemmatimonadota bacterium]